MKTNKELYLFDTNILIYALDSDSPQHLVSKSVFKLLKNNIINGVIAQQNILEAENVLVNTYNEPVKEVVKSIENVISSFNFLVISPLPSTYKLYHMLISDKKDIFDYYLSATMLDNKVNKIITFNHKDFDKIKDITAINPISFDLNV